MTNYDKELEQLRQSGYFKNSLIPELNFLNALDILENSMLLFTITLVIEPKVDSSQMDLESVLETMLKSNDPQVQENKLEARNCIKIFLSKTITERNNKQTDEEAESYTKGGNLNGQ